MSYLALGDERFDQVITLRDAYRTAERFLSNCLALGDISLSDALRMYVGEVSTTQTVHPAAIYEFLDAAEQVMKKPA